MNKGRLFLLFSVILCFSAIGISAQTVEPIPQDNSHIVKKDLSPAEIDRIVKNFTAKEADFRDALKGYGFSRNAVLQTIGLGGQVSGEYRRDSAITFGQDGARFEKILYFPSPTTPPGFVTNQDLEDLGGINPFALDPSSINLYNITYVGKEKIDELDLYVFDVMPKVIPNGKKTRQRVFDGRVWVDDRDLQIVKSKGKALPEGKDMDGFDQRFPIVETWRDNIDGKYWFPVFVSSDDTLVFGNGDVQKIRVRVKYGDYKVGRSEVRILDDDDPAATPSPSPTPTPKKP